MKISSRRCQVLSVEDGAVSHKIHNVKISLVILNLGEHPNRIAGSRVMAIMLNGWSFRGGGSAINRDTYSS